jgi:hypothetical protein
MGPLSGKRKRSSGSPAIGLRSDSEQAVVLLTARENDGIRKVVTLFLKLMGFDGVVNLVSRRQTP